MKRQDAQIYILFHKKVPYGIWDNALYTPLQVGAAFNEPLSELRDDTLDNVAEWNPIYAETTGTYWIWKNHPKDLKYVGQTQYRRRIVLKEDEDLDDLFSKYDVITMRPLRYTSMKVGEAYGVSHCKEDLDLLGEIIKDKYPEYVGNFEGLMGDDPFLFYSNGFIMKAEEFDRYCEWLFEIVEEFKRRKGWDTPQRATYAINLEILTGRRKHTDGTGKRSGDSIWKYQRQIFGFLSERIFTLWVLHNYDKKRVQCRPYKLFENTSY